MNQTSSRLSAGFLLGLHCLIIAAALLGAQQGGTKESLPSPEQRKFRAREADRWNQEGLRLFAEGRFVDAARAFQKVYELFPNVPDVGYNLGLAYQRAGRYEESVGPLRKSSSLKPSDHGVQRALGVSLLNVNRLREGAVLLERSLAGDPTNVDTLYYLALAYYDLKDFDRAEERLRWMFERNPDSALLHLRTGNTHRINRRYQEALAELQKARALDPNLPSLYLELGLTYIGLKDAAAAQTAIEEEVRRHPGSAEAHLTLGELFLVVKHDYARALEMIQRAQELGIEPVRAEFDLGDSYFRLNQLDDGERHLQQAVKLDPKHRRAHFLLAKVYQRQRKEDQARREFELAASLAQREQAELVSSFRTLAEGEESSK